MYSDIYAIFTREENMPGFKHLEENLHSDLWKWIYS